ncbi:tagaturonate reductase [Flavihumibacter sp. UBA7668]|uniref:tagaturonate reductase n=1 Tax=Flavihumibacter sp. UBA7668 TaxID=1946542 RepID=UPI0025C4C048|nr:tagaturonate reductase [Flavihumibacter sp. UBA7668]
MIQLSRKSLPDLKQHAGIELPTTAQLEFPERVLQFGTGVLLRGLPDYFIDKANRMGLYDGRVVIVKSTESGGVDVFARQDGLYTVCVKGIEEGRVIDELIINAAVSRVLAAKQEWAAILELAASRDLELILSNTTEVGIVYQSGSIIDCVPDSFPAKLLAFLYHRYLQFGNDLATGLVIVPTELIQDNGSTLKNMLIHLAEENQLGADFCNWLQEANHFCNSLVDRIVPGKLSSSDKEAVEQRINMKDDLMIMAEPFRLWAIESDHPKVKQALRFSQSDPGIIISKDISKFRELKLRMLNGTHTFSCGLAILKGFKTVKEAMQDPEMSNYIEKLMMEEIALSLLPSITADEAKEFGNKVLDRFRNPFIEHQWQSITLNYISKMKLRNIPLIKRYRERFNQIAPCMALGFAAYILFMERKDVGAVLADTELWGEDLRQINDFEASVLESIKKLS